MATSLQIFKKQIQLSGKSCFVTSELPCIKPGRIHFQLISSCRGNTLTSYSTGMEGNKDTETIWEEPYKAQLRKLNRKMPLITSSILTMFTFSFSAFHLFFHKTCLLFPHLCLLSLLCLQNSVNIQ